MESAGIQPPENPESHYVLDVPQGSNTRIQAPLPRVRVGVVPPAEAEKMPYGGMSAPAPRPGVPPLPLAEGQRKMVKSRVSVSISSMIAFLIILFFYTGLMIWANTLVWNEWFGMRFVDDDGNLAIQGNITSKSLGVKENAVFGNLQLIGSESTILSVNESDFHLQAGSGQSIILDGDLLLNQEFKIGNFDVMANASETTFAFYSPLVLTTTETLSLDGSAVTLKAGSDSNLVIQSDGKIDFERSVDIHSQSGDLTISGNTLESPESLTLSSQGDISLDATVLSLNGMSIGSVYSSRRSLASTSSNVVIDAVGQDGIKISPSGTGSIYIEEMLKFHSDSSEAVISVDVDSTDLTLSADGSLILDSSDSYVDITAGTTLTMQPSSGLVRVSEQLSTGKLTLSGVDSKLSSSSADSETGLTLRAASGSLELSSSGSVISEGNVEHGDLTISTAGTLSSTNLQLSSTEGLNVKSTSSTTLSASNLVSLTGKSTNMTNTDGASAIALSSEGAVLSSKNNVRLSSGSTTAISATRGELSFTAGQKVVLSSSSATINPASSLSLSGGALSLHTSSALSVSAPKFIMSGKTTRLSTSSTSASLTLKAQLGSSVTVSTPTSSGSGVSISSTSGGLSLAAGYTASSVKDAPTRTVKLAAAADTLVQGVSGLSYTANSGSSSAAMTIDTASVSMTTSKAVNFVSTLDHTVSTATLGVDASSTVTLDATNTASLTGKTVSITSNSQPLNVTSGSLSVSTVSGNLLLAVDGSSGASVTSKGATTVTSTRDLAMNGTAASVTASKLLVQSGGTFAAAGAALTLSGDTVRVGSNQVRLTATTGATTVTTTTGDFGVQADNSVTVDAKSGITYKSPSNNLSMILSGGSAALDASTTAQVNAASAAVSLGFDNSTTNVIAGNLNVRNSKTVDLTGAANQVFTFPDGSSTRADILSTGDLALTSGSVGASFDASTTATLKSVAGLAAVSSAGALSLTATTSGVNVTASTSATIAASSALGIQAQNAVTFSSAGLTVKSDQATTLTAGGASTFSAKGSALVHTSKGDITATTAKSATFSTAGALDVTGINGVTLDGRNSASLSGSSVNFTVAGPVSVVSNTTVGMNSAADVKIMAAKGATFSASGTLLASSGRDVNVVAGSGALFQSSTANVNIKSAAALSLTGLTADLTSGGSTQLDPTGAVAISGTEATFTADGTGSLSLHAKTLTGNSTAGVATVASRAGALNVVAGVAAAAKTGEVYLGASRSIGLISGSSGMSLSTVTGDTTATALSKSATFTAATSLSATARGAMTFANDGAVTNTFNAKADDDLLLAAGSASVSSSSSGKVLVLGASNLVRTQSQTLQATAVTGNMTLQADQGNLAFQAATSASLTASAGPIAVTAGALTISAGQQVFLDSVANKMNLRVTGALNAVAVNDVTISAPTGITIKTTGTFASTSSYVKIATNTFTLSESSTDGSVTLAAASTKDAYFEAKASALNLNAAKDANIFSDATLTASTTNSTAQIGATGANVLINAVTSATFTGAGVRVASGMVDTSISAVQQNQVAFAASGKTAVTADKNINIRSKAGTFSSANTLSVSAASVSSTHSTFTSTARTMTLEGLSTGVLLNAGSTTNARTLEVSHANGVKMSTVGGAMSIAAQNGSIAFAAMGSTEGTLTLATQGALTAASQTDITLAAANTATFQSTNLLTVQGSGDFVAAAADGVLLSAGSSADSTDPATGNLLVRATSGTVDVTATSTFAAVSDGTSGLTADSATTLGLTSTKGSVSLLAADLATVNAGTIQVGNGAAGTTGAVSFVAGSQTVDSVASGNVQLNAQRLNVTSDAGSTQFTATADSLTARSVSGAAALTAGAAATFSSTTGGITVSAHDDSIVKANGIVVNAGSATASYTTGSVQLAASAMLQVNQAAEINVHAGSSSSTANVAITTSSKSVTAASSELTLAAGANAKITSSGANTLQVTTGDLRVTAPVVNVAAATGAVSSTSTQFTASLVDTTVWSDLTVTDRDVVISANPTGDISVTANTVGISVSNAAGTLNSYSSGSTSLTAAAGGLKVDATDRLSVAAHQSQGALTITATGNAQFSTAGLNDTLLLQSFNDGKTGGSLHATATSNAVFSSSASSVQATGRDGVALTAGSTKITGARVQLNSWVQSADISTRTVAADGRSDVYAQNNVTVAAANNVVLNSQVGLLDTTTGAFSLKGQNVTFQGQDAVNFTSTQDAILTADQRMTILAGSTTGPSIADGDLAVGAQNTIAVTAGTTLTVESTGSTGTLAARTTFDATATNGHVAVRADAGNVAVSGTTVSVLAQSENFHAQAANNVVLEALTGGLDLHAGSCMTGAFDDEDTANGAIKVNACGAASSVGATGVHVTATTGNVNAAANSGSLSGTAQSVNAQATTLSVSAPANTLLVQSASGTRVLSSTDRVDVSAATDVFAGASRLAVVAGASTVPTAAEGQVLIQAAADSKFTSSSAMNFETTSGAVSVNGNNVAVTSVNSAVFTGGVSDQNMNTGGVNITATDAATFSATGTITLQSGHNSTAPTSTVQLSNSQINVDTKGYILVDGYNVNMNAKDATFTAAASYVADLTASAVNTLSLRQADLIATAQNGLTVAAGPSARTNATASTNGIGFVADGAVIARAATTFSASAEGSITATSLNGDVRIIAETNATHFRRPPAGVPIDIPFSAGVTVLDTSDSITVDTTAITVSASTVDYTAGTQLNYATESAMTWNATENNMQVTANKGSLLYRAIPDTLGVQVSAGLTTTPAVALGQIALLSEDALHLTTVKDIASISVTANTTVSATNVVMTATSYLNLQSTSLATSDVQLSATDTTTGTLLAQTQTLTLGTNGTSTSSLLDLNAADNVRFTVGTTATLSATNIAVTSPYLELSSQADDAVAGNMNIIVDNDAQFTGRSNVKLSANKNLKLASTSGQLSLTSSDSALTICPAGLGLCTTSASEALVLTPGNMVFTSAGQLLAESTAAAATLSAVTGPLAITAAAGNLYGTVTAGSSNNIALSAAGKLRITANQSGAALSMTSSSATGAVIISGTQATGLSARSSTLISSASNGLFVTGAAGVRLESSSVDANGLEFYSENTHFTAPVVTLESSTGAFSVAASQTSATGVSIDTNSSVRFSAGQTVTLAASAGSVAVTAPRIAVASTTTTAPAATDSLSIDSLGQAEDTLMSATDGAFSTQFVLGADLQSSGTFSVTAATTGFMESTDGTVTMESTGTNKNVNLISPTTITGVADAGANVFTVNGASLSVDNYSDDRAYLSEGTGAQTLLLQAGSANAFSLTATNAPVIFTATQEIAFATTAGHIDLTLKDTAAASHTLSHSLQSSDTNLLYTTDKFEIAGANLALRAKITGATYTAQNDLLANATTTLNVVGSSGSGGNLYFEGSEDLNMTAALGITFQPYADSGVTRMGDIRVQTPDSENAYTVVQGGMRVIDTDGGAFDAPSALTRCKTGDIRWTSDNVYVCVDGDSASAKWKLASLVSLNGTYTEAWVMSMQYNVASLDSWGTTQSDSVASQLGTDLNSDVQVIGEEKSTVTTRRRRILATTGQVTLTLQITPESTTTASSIKTGMQTYFSDMISGSTICPSGTTNPLCPSGLTDGAITTVYAPPTITSNPAYQNYSLTASYNAVPNVFVKESVTSVTSAQNSQSANITIVVDDFEDAAADVTLVVSSENPILLSNTASNVIGSVLDANTQQLIISGTGERVVSFMPNTDATGDAVITFTVIDSLGAQSSINITYTCYAVSANKNPVISTSTTDTTMLEDASLTGIVLVLSDDRDNAKDLPLWAEYTMMENSTSGYRAYGHDLGLQFTFSGSGSTRYMNVYPAASRYGKALVTVKTQDSVGAIGTNTFVLTVSPVTDNATITGLPDMQNYEDITLGILQFNLTDIDGEPADISLSPLLTESAAAIVPGQNLNFVHDDIVMIDACSTLLKDIVAVQGLPYGYTGSFGCPASCYNGFLVTDLTMSTAASELTITVDAIPTYATVPAYLVLKGDGVMRDAHDNDVTSKTMNTPMTLKRIDTANKQFVVSMTGPVNGMMYNSFFTQHLLAFPASTSYRYLTDVEDTPIRLTYSEESVACDGAAAHAGVLSTRYVESRYTVKVDANKLIVPYTTSENTFFGDGLYPGDVIRLYNSATSTLDSTDRTVLVVYTNVFSSTPNMTLSTTAGLTANSGPYTMYVDRLSARTFTLTPVSDTEFLVDPRSTSVNGTGTVSLPYATNHSATDNTQMKTLKVNSGDFTQLTVGSTIRVYYNGTDRLTVDPDSNTATVLDISTFTAIIGDYIYINGEQKQLMATGSLGSVLYLDNLFTRADATVLNLPFLYAREDRTIVAVDSTTGTVTVDTPYPSNFTYAFFTVISTPRFTLLGSTSAASVPSLTCDATDADASVDVRVTDLECSDWRVSTASSAIPFGIAHVMRCPAGCLAKNHMDGTYSVSSVAEAGEGKVRIKANSYINNSTTLMVTGNTVCGYFNTSSSVLNITTSGHNITAGETVYFQGAPWSNSVGYVATAVYGNTLRISVSNANSYIRADQCVGSNIMVQRVNYATGYYVQVALSSSTTRTRKIKSINTGTFEMVIEGSIDMDPNVNYTFSVMNPYKLKLDNPSVDSANLTKGLYLHLHEQTTRVINSFDNSTGVIIVDSAYDLTNGRLVENRFRFSSVLLYGGVNGTPYTGQTSICSAALREGLYTDTETDPIKRTFTLLTANVTSSSAAVTNFTDDSAAGRVVPYGATGSELQAFYLSKGYGPVSVVDADDRGTLAQRAGPGRSFRVTCSAQCLSAYITPLIIKTDAQNRYFLPFHYMDIDTVTRTDLGSGTYRYLIKTSSDASPVAHNLLDSLTYQLADSFSAPTTTINVTVSTGSSCSSTCGINAFEVSTTSASVTDSWVLQSATPSAWASKVIHKNDVLMIDLSGDSSASTGVYTVKRIDTSSSTPSVQLVSDLPNALTSGVAVAVLSRDVYVAGDNENGYAPGSSICIAAIHAAADGAFSYNYVSSSATVHDRTFLVTMVNTTAGPDSTDAKTPKNGIVPQSSTAGSIGFRFSNANLQDSTLARDSRGTAPGAATTRYVQIIPGENRSGKDVLISVDGITRNYGLISDTYRVTVDAVADGINFVADNYTLNEMDGTCESYLDQCTVAFDEIEAELLDSDGSESALNITIRLPLTGTACEFSILQNGAPLTMTNTGSGCDYVLSTDSMDNDALTSTISQLRVIPPVNYPPTGSDGMFAIQLLGATVEASLGTSEAAYNNLTIYATVSPIADAPYVSVVDVTSTEQTWFTYNVSNSLVDTDGSETLQELFVYDIPSSSSLRHSSTLETISPQDQKLQCNDEAYVDWSDDSDACRRTLSHADLQGPVGTVKYVRCPPGCTSVTAGTVNGMVFYNGESSICRASIHAGVFSDIGGVVRVVRVSNSYTSYPTPDCSGSATCTRNGVDLVYPYTTSTSYFMVDKVNFVEDLAVTSLSYDSSSQSTTVTVSSGITFSLGARIMISKAESNGRARLLAGSSNLYTVTSILSNTQFKFTPLSTTDALAATWTSTALTTNDVRVSSGILLCNLYKLAQGNFSDLQFNFTQKGSFSTKASATTVEELNSNTAKTVKDLLVTVNSKSDAPIVTVGAAATATKAYGTADHLKRKAGDYFAIGPVWAQATDVTEVMTCISVHNVPSISTLFHGLEAATTVRTQPTISAIASAGDLSGDGINDYLITVPTGHFVTHNYTASDVITVRFSTSANEYVVYGYPSSDNTQFYVEGLLGETLTYTAGMTFRDAGDANYFVPRMVDTGDDFYSIFFDCTDTDFAFDCWTMNATNCVSDDRPVTYETDIQLLTNLWFMSLDQLQTGDITLNWFVQSIDPITCTGGADNSVTFIDPSTYYATSDCTVINATTVQNITIQHINEVPGFSFSSSYVTSSAGVYYLSLPEDTPTQGGQYSRTVFLTSVSAGSSAEDSYQLPLTSTLTCTSGCDVLTNLYWNATDTPNKAYVSFQLVPNVAGQAVLLFNLTDNGLDAYGADSYNGALWFARELVVEVHPRADNPFMSAENSGLATSEDTGIPLDLTVSAYDTDGSEDLIKFVFTNIPAGLQLKGPSDPTYQVASGTSYTVSLSGGSTYTASTLYIKPPVDSDLDLAFNLAVQTEEDDIFPGEDDAYLIASTSIAVNVPVHADADAPTLTMAASAGDEDTAIMINPTVTLVDTDGSETIRSFTLTNSPAGASFSIDADLSVTQNSDSSPFHFSSSSPLVTMDNNAVAIVGISIVPSANCDRDFTMSAMFYSTESNGGDTQVSGSQPFTTTVHAVADDATVSLSPMTTQEARLFNVPYSVSLVDTDGSEAISAIYLGGLPDSDVSFATGTTGFVSSLDLDGLYRIESSTGSSFSTVSLSVTTPQDCDYDFALTMQVETREANDVTSTFSSSTTSASITVYPVADQPTLTTFSTGSTNEDFSVTVTVSPFLTDTDGSERIVRFDLDIPASGFSAANFAHDANLVVDTTSTHTLSLVPLTNTISISSLPRPWLTFIPPTNCDVNFVMTMTVTTQEDGSNPLDASALTFTSTSLSRSMVILGVADAPAITVNAGIQTDEDVAGAANIAIALSDTDGSEILYQLAMIGMPQGTTVSISGNAEVYHFSDSTTRGSSMTSTGTSDQINVQTLSGFDLFSSISNLRVTSDDNCDLDFTLTLMAVSQERNGGDTESSTTRSVAIVLNAVPDTPAMSFNGISAPTGSATFTSEDRRVSLPVALTLYDTDGSETIRKLLIGPISSGMNGNVNAPSTMTPVTESSVNYLQVSGTFTSGTAIPGLSLSHVANCDVDFAVTFSGATTERNTGSDSAYVTQSVAVTVYSFPDYPIVTSTVDHAPIETEDQCRTLGVEFYMYDTDSSESLSMRLAIGTASGITSLDSFTFYTDNTCTSVVSGSYFSSRTSTVAARSFGHPGAAAQSCYWYFKTPQHCDYDFNLDYVWRVSEDKTGATIDYSNSDIVYTIQAVADSPTVTASDVTGNEQACIRLNIDANLVDADGSEALDGYLTVVSPSPSARFNDVVTTSTSNFNIYSDSTCTSALTYSGDRWLVSYTQVKNSVYLKMTSHVASDVALTFTAYTTEGATGTQLSGTGISSTVSQSLYMQVLAITDTPDITASYIYDVVNVGGSYAYLEDTGAVIGYEFDLVDTDSSQEFTRLTVSNIPAGSSISAVTNTVINYDTTTRVATYDVTAGTALRSDNLIVFTIVPPVNCDTDFVLTAKVTTTEMYDAEQISGASSVDSSLVAYRYPFAAVADMPTLTLTASQTGDEDTFIPINFSTTLTDTDGSESLTIKFGLVSIGDTDYADDIQLSFTSSTSSPSLVTKNTDGYWYVYKSMTGSYTDSLTSPTVSSSTIYMRVNVANGNQYLYGDITMSIAVTSTEVATGTDVWTATATTATSTFTMSVQPTNDVPTCAVSDPTNSVTYLSASGAVDVDEDTDYSSSKGTTFGYLFPVDPDSVIEGPSIGETYSYLFVYSDGTTSATSPDGYFQISGNALVRTQNYLNFEANNVWGSYGKPAYVPYTVKATDKAGTSGQCAMSIEVNDLNETPIEISVTQVTYACGVLADGTAYPSDTCNFAVPENLAIGSEVAIITTKDVDLADTFTFSLSSTANNATVLSLFSIRSINDSHAAIDTAGSFDYETMCSPTEGCHYTLTVGSSDQGGLTLTSTLLVTVRNVNEAPIATVTTQAVSVTNLMSSAAYEPVFTDVDHDFYIAAGINNPDTGSVESYGEFSVRLQIQQNQNALIRNDNTTTGAWTDFFQLSVASSNPKYLCTCTYQFDYEPFAVGFFFNKSAAVGSVSIALVEYSDNGLPPAAGPIFQGMEDTPESISFTWTFTRTNAR